MLAGGSSSSTSSIAWRRPSPAWCRRRGRSLRPRFLRRLAWIATALLLLGAGRTAADDRDDPFPARDPFPLRLLFLEPSPAGAATLSPGRGKVSIETSYANTLVATDDLIILYARSGQTWDGRVSLPILQAVAAAQPSHTAFLYDGETLRTAIRARYGLAPRAEIGVEVPFLSQGSGFMDAPIDDFHRRLHLPDGGRPGFAHDQYRAAYIGDGETVFIDRSSPGIRPGDIVLSTTGALLTDRGRIPALGATLSAKLPTGDYRHLDGSGSFDWSLAVRLSKRLGRSTLHGGYSLARLGPWRLAPAVEVRDSRSLFAAYVFAATPETSLIAQVRRDSSPFPFRPGNDLGRVAMDVMAGFRHRLPKRIELDWSFIENIDSYYNTIDVGAFFGITCSVGPSAPAAGAARLQATTR